MLPNWYLIFGYALVESFLLSIALTMLMRRIALRWNLVDKPGARKMHDEPKPLMGGVAIYLTFNLVIGVNILLLPFLSDIGFTWLEENVLTFLGENPIRQLTGIFAGAFVIFLLGVVDDIKVLSPELKLFGQIAAALVLVVSDIHLELFIDRILVLALPPEMLPTEWVDGISVALSWAATIVWVVMITNAMNFLDNMDGLSGGVSVIAALAFFLCVLPQEEYFVSALLMVFAGSVTGFLYHNLNPARIFMGDAGSMFCGYILATVAVIGTFYTGEGANTIAIAAPLLALCVPMFDLFSVVYIRWRRGESIMKGDKRHFSHRLVELGMTPRQAVEFIFLVAAVTGLGGALLAQVSLVGTLVILLQTAGIFLLIVLLMRAARNKERAT